MSDINLLAVILAPILAFVASSVWYIALGKQLAALNPIYADAQSPPPTTILAELVRTLVLAFILAYLIVEIDIDALGRALQLGVLLWIGFPVVLLSGSVLHEKVPWKLAAIHAGDWLLKLLLLSAILGLWR